MKKTTFNHSETRILQAVDEVIPLHLNIHGELLCSQIFSCTDETSVPAQVDFGYLRGASFVPLKSHLAPAINFTLALETPLWMVFDDVPAVRITTGAIGDHVQLAMSGYVLRDE